MQTCQFVQRAILTPWPAIRLLHGELRQKGLYRVRSSRHGPPFDCFTANYVRKVCTECDPHAMARHSTASRRITPERFVQSAILTPWPAIRLLHAELRQKGLYRVRSSRHGPPFDCLRRITPERSATGNNRH